MKKLICVLLLVALLATVFAGCVGSFTCDLCGEEKFGAKNEENFLGQTVTYCNDCKNSLKDLYDMFS